jgi:hypothetical protein
MSATVWLCSAVRDSRLIFYLNDDQLRGVTGIGVWVDRLSKALKLLTLPKPTRMDGDDLGAWRYLACRDQGIQAPHHLACIDGV